MSDRELLEKAATAAGLHFHGHRETKTIAAAWVSTTGNTDDWFCWNPLADDGDALRLAVKLGIDLQLFRAIPQEFRPHDLFARACVDRIGRCFGEQVVNDPYAATRRAIVRAAADLADR